MILNRIRLSRRIIAALGDAHELANRTDSGDLAAKFSALQGEACRDLGDVVCNAYNNGGIAEPDARSALRPIYSTRHEDQQTNS
ncbi:hypothetical protein [Streptomyces sp. NPDC018045]|uniref:hypothetical protein n=1 Tax=unclassified Streptomyces TaxID=2593676 RepID=UPI0037B26BD3